MNDKLIYRGRTITIDDVPQYMYKLRPNCNDILKAYVKKLEDKVRYSKENPKKIKKWNLKGGGDFDIELKIPKEMVNQGVMYGYKKGGQV